MAGWFMVISNLDKKRKDYFSRSKTFLARIQAPFIAELNDNKQLNLQKQHLNLQSSQAA